MPSDNKLILDSSRRFLVQIKKGYVKEINIPVMRQIMLDEFDSNYGPVNESDFESVAKLVTDLYRHYDAWLINNPQTKVA